MRSFEPKIAAESKAFDREEARDRPRIDRASEWGREQLSKDGHLKLTTEVVGREPKLAIFHISVDRMWEREKEGKGEGREEIRKELH